ncbi:MULTISPECIES: hypothetical protein [unclassified Streptomyces]|uniref:hypothetical protein n=1 Tax=unclassified Streptomyces TaxID=2593676 RepID=UPI002DDC317E|nr:MULTISPECIES: hypothetical protein [unclassified Streptomyces]WSA96440.1 hypothetical protein OIE63_36420 [Streptomyces sp. NBC_01795]WSB80852.1 hypothetical protein OHB04_37540 [Streptomyces sp. NBC_01775]WSS10936.1 hypothetical protein OG533_02715 [Streptomyces sp. NBC_01186]WSS39640.1 hypothetical protein OG220_02790 [Streptomyces sp. NBC_01187]
MTQGTETTGRMKQAPDHEDEILDVRRHQDPGRNRLTPVVKLPPEVALAVVESLAGLVRAAHRGEEASPTPADALKQAQEFEEGDVFMLEPPFEGFFADRYLMDFYDTAERDICSRMHLHTGLRFVRMMTGPETTIRVSSLSPITVRPSAGWTGPLNTFADALPGTPAGLHRDRHNVIVPPNSWVDMQIPRGVSHQFNAVGPNAVIDSVHPEESIETLREGMSGYRMMAQTIFLAKDKSPATTCADPTAPDDSTRH